MARASGRTETGNGGRGAGVGGDGKVIGAGMEGLLDATEAPEILSFRGLFNGSVGGPPSTDNDAGCTPNKRM